MVYFWQKDVAPISSVNQNLREYNNVLNDFYLMGD